MIQKINRPEKDIPQKKIQLVEELSNLINKKKTILLTSIKNIPASQFQIMSKQLRETAIIKVPKKNLILRAIDNSKNEDLKKIKDQIHDNVAIIFSDLDCFDLALELIENKTPAKAKPGQEAPKDIEISAGPTDLIPGPAISEFGNLGIPIQIEKGKIVIKKSKVIVKKGELISKNVAEILNKLDVRPFSVGFTPLAAFDTEKKKFYGEIKIDKEKTIENLKNAFSKGLAFAVEVKYISKETLKFLIAKASSHENVIDKLIKEKQSKEKDSSEENLKEKKTEEKKENGKKEDEETLEKEKNNEDTKKTKLENKEE